MRLTTAGSPRNFDGAIVGRLTLTDLPFDKRAQSVRLVVGEDPRTTDDRGYRAMLAAETLETNQPVIERLREVDHFRDGDVVVLEGKSGFIRSLYRPNERHHSLFVTERCSSNCLMCSQPPKDRDDIPALSERNRELIALMSPAPPYLTITGGEPTLLGEGLFELIRQLKVSLPDTELHMLTNGRTLAWPEYTAKLAAVEHPNLCLGIPLYSDCAGEHDHVVQAQGAFDQTVAGFHQAARHGIRLEVRVVLHMLTIPRLIKLAEYIYRNLSFVEHVALMGLEYVGYTPRNIESLWVDPFDYQHELEAATTYLAIRNMNVSIYNHQLCVLKPSLWPFARKSISDWKNLYLPVCEQCREFERCGGLFKWAEKKHSAHIHAL
jgi:His-Xaa-Ser system radical SAM maturase HxsC